ncbi:MAG: acetate--CoA ligase family protein, partial [Alphaproteobacteria bacterium]
MTIRNFDHLFRPHSVAVIGASRDPASVGGVVARNLFAGGFEGPVFPVNPKATAIGSALAWPDVESLPLTPELAVIATPAPTVPGIIDALGKRGTKAAIIISAGFGEAGKEGEALQQQVLEACRPHLLRIVGPNCVGVLVPRIGLNASFAHRPARPGGIAFLSQSGAVLTSVLDWAEPRRLGFSHMVSMGGMADVDFGDMLDYLGRDPTVGSILLYMESVLHARKFMSAARAAARLKPVVVIKPGRYQAAAKAAASHTGALAGSDAVYDAAFRRAGMLRVPTLESLFDAVETVSRVPALQGERLAILTNGGGVGVLATDRLFDAGGALADLAPETMERLNGVLPATWSHGNPVDIIGDAPGSRYADAFSILNDDPSVDAILVLNCPTAVADSTEAAEAVLQESGGGAHKPVFTSWLGERAAAEARAMFSEADIPTYDTPGQAIDSFGRLVTYARNQALLMQVPPPPHFAPEDRRREARDIVAKARDEGREWLTEPEAKAVLKAYSIPVVETRTAASPEEAAEVAGELGLPAALKILSHDITHKTDVGGVTLGLTDEDAVREEARAMLERVGEAAPEARLDGFAVQPMAERPGAHELIVGIAGDPLFGPVILFGHGGTAVEVVRDQALALPPLSPALARDLISRTRISRLLKGYRDRKPADMDAIVRTLMNLSELAADLREVGELDVNPLWASHEGVLALDARMRLIPRGREGQDFAVMPYP